MAEPTEDEVRAHLETEARIADRGAAVAREVGMSDLAHARLASIYRSALAMLDEARKDKERLAHLRRLFVESAERLTDEDTVLRCSVSVVGRVSNVELNYFGGTRKELLASKFDALVDAAIDQARGA